MNTLDTKPKVEENIIKAILDAYDYYLKVKEKFEKLQNKEDIELVIGLVNNAIEN